MIYAGVFDEWMAKHEDGLGKIPENWRAAAIDVHDTLFLAYLSAKQIFGDAATPEHAIAICRIMIVKEQQK